MDFKALILILIISTNLVCSLMSGLKKEDFEKEIDGKKVHLFVLTNKKGYEVALTNYGGSICAIMVPDKKGNIENVVHGHDSLENILNVLKSI